ncbi:potassium-transporting ATPase subunit KdpC [Bacillus sp. REN10]|uniref:potassium-transporting ATPase subunit KdpC n=1 Tax=Bacillus sp. REN10 TaxID=2782541 RepID=UPI00193B0A96|nr:potassium-transporting ATPase subunit KdpC [Bacillus sp. REN10]
MLKIIRLSLLMIVLCGIAYPLAMTGLGQLLFPAQANGSLIENEKGKVVGSELIGQKFDEKSYFYGRVSSIEYDASASGSNNYAPSNADMLKRVKQSIADIQEEYPEIDLKDIPVDLITNSGSGLDPHISVAAAKFQVERVSKETGINENTLNKAIDETTEARSLQLFGEPRVNVLKLNIKIQELKK